MDNGEPTARDAAKGLAMGFVSHDAGDYDGAVRNFTVADRFQFQHVDSETAHEAAEAYTDALFAKDRLEDEHESVPPPGSHLWDETWQSLLRRARLLGMNLLYANKTVTSWARHKYTHRRADYWTPLCRAQQYEVQVAIQDPEYPEKSRGGTDGFGHLPPLYLFGVELHDMISMHDDPSPEQMSMGLDVLELYFDEIRRLQQVTD